MSALPVALDERLQRLRPILERGGCVQLHGGRDRRPSYRIRYRERSAHDTTWVQRSIGLGDDETIATQTSALLRSWQSEHKARVASQKSSEKTETTRQLIREVGSWVAAAGGGRVVQRHAKAEFRKVADSPIDSFSYIANETWRYFRRPGRPRTKALW